MNAVIEFLQNHIKIVGTVCMLTVLWLAKLQGALMIRRMSASARARLVWRQTLNVTVWTLAGFLLVYTWFDWFRSMLTLLSLVSAALVVVNKELLLNMFAYSILIWRSTFVIGDRIKIDDTSGDVIEIGPFYFVLAETVNDKFTGRTVKMPNAIILTKPVTNDAHTDNLVWHTIDVSFEKDRNVETARNMLMRIVEPLSIWNRTHRVKLDLAFTCTKPEVTFRLDDDKLIASVRYPCHVKDRATTENQFWEAFIAQTADEYESALAGH